MSAVIAFEGLTKRFGSVTALDQLTAEVAPGRITAFLGANGSGKTTSMRLLLGLDAPTAGTATVGGRAYATLERPTRVVGAVVDQGFHPSRSARNHVRLVAAQAGAPRARGEAMLELVGLADVGDRRVGGYSLGMRQRLALASALVGDPEILVLDEPFNGLDPDGIATMRHFLRGFADEGRTVFLSSHLLAEVAHSADDAVIIDHGRLVTAGPLDSLVPDVPTLLVRTGDADLLAVTLRHRGATVDRQGPEELLVAGVDREVVGRTALEIGAVVLEMRGTGDDLESVFARLTAREASAT
jgi:ABC-2 type transport system ATP-binding protein